MHNSRQEQRLVGHALCPGIAIGPIALHRPKPLLSDHQAFLCYDADVSIPKEIQRYKKALKQSCLDLHHLRESLLMKGANEAAAILEAQEQMLQDPLLSDDIESQIRQKQLRAETLFCAAIQKLEEQLRSSSAHLSDAYTDLEDVAGRVLRHLRNTDDLEEVELPKGAVIYAKELSPSETIEALESVPAAFLTERGGPLSHSAIIAKAAGVPYITKLPSNAFSKDDVGSCVIVDATCGEIIISPSSALCRDYQEKQKQWCAAQIPFSVAESVPAYTQDGHLIRLSINMEIDSDLSLLHTYGSSGVGLLRSEHLISSLNHFPSEAEQFMCYRKMVRQMQGLPIIIRVFDIDEAQVIRTHQTQTTPNSQMGWRAIRFLLREPKIFHTQLRAILRASIYGNIGIMFPLISGLQELRDAKHHLHLVRQQLENEGIPVAPHIRVGCMIEVPSAAMIVDLLAKECDFLSIGTNDLIQYCLAVDRENPSLSLHYTAAHPAIIRLVYQIILMGSTNHIPITVCGEMGSDPEYTALLIGLGIRELSVPPRHIPRIKHVIRQTNLAQAQQLAQKVLQLATKEDILAALGAFKHKPAELQV